METKDKIILTAWSCALLLFCLSVEATSCWTGWFGSKCQYKCRCTNNSCDSRGQCRWGSKCERGWFGPACQYVDLAYRNGDTYNATDGDNTTCVPTSTKSVKVTLNDSYHFTWLRIHVKRSDSLHSLTLRFRGNYSLGCINQRNFRVDNTTLDIHCDLNETVKYVTLIGEGVQDLCTVNINGACGAGWFGSKCQYKCRCTNNSCDSEGQCIGRAKCETGWFGPACQYVDLPSRGRYNNRIRDGDETTCVTARPQSVTVTLDDLCHFTWLRVHLRQPDFLHDLTVTFNSNLSCTNPRNSSVDDTTLDIYCDLNQRVQNVTLTGTAVQDLCSVYISGGRNVALKQNTSQSSTYQEQTWNTRYKNISFTSDKAVDGDTSGDFYTGYPCSCTRDTGTGSTWTVRFSKPQRVSRYVLYNRESASEYRIIGFILESFSESGDRMFSYTDKTSSHQLIYRIPSENVTSPVSRVMIKRNVTTYMTICELEIYGVLVADITAGVRPISETGQLNSAPGRCATYLQKDVVCCQDSVCEPGQYGRECEHKCNCARNEACFVSTGGCPSGCADGFQGENCNETCEAGKYGANCKFNCSQFCQLPSNGSQESSCDHVDGTCKHGCQPGYEGKLCSSEQAVIMDGTVSGICVAVAVVLIITIILAVVVCRRRFRTQSPYDRPDNTQQDNYPYIQAGSSEAGYEGVSRIKTHPHNVKTGEVNPDSNKMQQELGALSCDETDMHIYEDVHADKDNSGRNKCDIYSNI